MTQLNNVITATVANHQIRAVRARGVEWFVLVDILTAMGYSTAKGGYFQVLDGIAKEHRRVVKRTTAKVWGSLFGNGNNAPQLTMVDLYAVYTIAQRRAKRHDIGGFMEAFNTQFKCAPIMPPRPVEEYSQDELTFTDEPPVGLVGYSEDIDPGSLTETGRYEFEKWLHKRPRLIPSANIRDMLRIGVDEFRYFMWESGLATEKGHIIWTDVTRKMFEVEIGENDKPRSLLTLHGQLALVELMITFGLIDNESFPLVAGNE